MKKNISITASLSFKKAILLCFLLCFVAFAQSQEICNNGIDDNNNGLIDLNDTVGCTCSSPVLSLIPNPSFEDLNCCPSGFSQLNCAQGWIQASEGTSDFMNNCGFVFGAAQAANLVPFPDGNGSAGFISTDQYKEYIGACLNAPMLSGSSYSLQINIASTPIDNAGGVCNGGAVYYSPSDIVLYGSASCGDLPFTGYGCAPSNWQILGSVTYTPVNTWGVITITFTPSVNINAIMIGAPCTLPGDYTLGGACYPYFYVDNLLLNLTSLYTSNISQTGTFCAHNLQLSGNAVPSGLYQWYLNGVALVGQTNLTLNVSANNLPLGNYTLQTSVGTSCASSSYVVSTGVVPPVINPVGSFCPNEAVINLTADSTGGIWSGSGITDSITGSFDPSIANVGNDTIIYTMPDTGICSSADTIIITVGTLPTLSSSLTTPDICSGTLFSYTPTSTLLGASFAWIRPSISGISNAPASGNGNPNEILVNTTPSPIVVTYFYTVSGNGCTGNVTVVTVTVNPKDLASFQYTSGTYCNSGIDPAPAITGLSGGSFTSSPAGLSINGTTGIIDLSSSIIGVYSVTYTTSGTCPDSSSITITISNTSTVASFSYASGSFCQNASNPSPLFASGSSAGAFTSSPVGLVFLNVNTGEIDLSASTPGAYTITNTIAPSGNCNTNSATASIVITPADNSMFYYSSATYCNSGINPTPTITGLTGGVFTSTPAGLVINASTGVIDLATSTLGAYALSYFTSGPCPDTTSILMTITDSTPTADFAYIDSVFCQNEGNYTPYYIGGSSAGYYTAIPSGLVFVQVNTGEIDLAASAPGTYVINNIIPPSGSCAADSASTTIIVNASPVVTAPTSMLMVCDSTTISINLSSTTPGTSFHWIVNEIGVSGASASNGSTISQTLTLTGTSQGAATYIVTPTAASCMGDSLVIPVFVNPLPQADTSSVVTTSASCTSATGSITGITIASGQGPFQYQWLDSTGAVVDTSINLSNVPSGTYTLVITDLNGCSSTPSSFSVSSTDTFSPTIDTSAIVTTSSSCTGATGSITGITIASGQGPFQYQWLDSTGAVVDTSINLSNAPSGTYTLVITDANGCSAISDSFAVTSSSSSGPNVDTAAMVVVAANCGDSTGSITGLIIVSGQLPFQYQWKDSIGNIVSTSLTLNNMPAGNYTLTVTDGNGCNVVSSGYHITDLSPPVNASYMFNPISGENPLIVNFTNSSTGASNYLWHFGTGDSSTVTNPEYTYLPFGSFTVCLIASNNTGCKDTACSQIDIAVNSVFIVPNVFTPNNDNVNDIFWVIGDGFKTMDVSIYNRWGQRIYEWHTINGGWDGRTTSGVLAADGTYYYIVNATKINGKVFKKNGYFSLLKN